MEVGSWREWVCYPVPALTTGKLTPVLPSVKLGELTLLPGPICGFRGPQPALATTTRHSHMYQQEVLVFGSGYENELP